MVSEEVSITAASGATTSGGRSCACPSGASQWNSKGFASPVSSSQVSNLFQEFERGNIAMYISGPWQIGEFTNRLPKNMQDKWMTAPMPGVDGPGVSLAGGASLALFKRSTHKTEAWQLMEFLSRPEIQLQFYRLTGDLPARRESWKDTALANNKYAHAFREQLDRVVPTPQVPEWEQIATKVFEDGEPAVRGKKTVDQALATLDADVNSILEKRRYLLSIRKPAACGSASPMRKKRSVGRRRRWRRSILPRTPRCAAASADSTTMEAAPIPRIIPWRRRSNGVAASSTESSVAAAPEARKPEATQGRSRSVVTSSAETTTTRRQRPARIQSSAREIAWVVLAHAALICVLGPRAPMISANWE